MIAGFEAVTEGQTGSAARYAGPRLDPPAPASRHVCGAILEIVWLEPPPPDARLLKLDNVMLAPHIAGATTTVRSAARMAAEEIRRHAAGEPPLNSC